jgi:transcriptional regulator with GAF, ATPase, and Fis domain
VVLGEGIGVGPGWTSVLHEVGLVAQTDATVLVCGETGTGKELVARALHRGSRRRDGPFVAVNCGALSEELIASELFGHEKGAFTGALQQRLGHVERASGGTLFLDEIGDLALDLQVKLLRFLQDREFERVGGTQAIRADVRVVAATNRELERLRSEGRFRDDLYFRLNVFPIRVPPLRERREDIVPLLGAFVERCSRKVGKRFSTIDRQSLVRCEEYPWPGNVRELENLVERSVILCPEPVFFLNPFAQAEASAPGSAHTTLHALIRAHIVRTLKLCQGRIYGEAGAARLLGLKPSTLQSKLKRLGIDRSRL